MRISGKLKNSNERKTKIITKQIESEREAETERKRVSDIISKTNN